MIEDMERCASAALGHSGETWALTTDDLIAVENGHHFHRGWHIGWAWNTDADGRRCIDILSEHRMTDMNAMRVFLEREYFEHNRRAYNTLRKAGLLPPLGGNIGSQDINEYLRSGMESEEAP